MLIEKRIEELCKEIVDEGIYNLQAIYNETTGWTRADEIMLDLEELLKEAIPERVRKWRKEWKEKGTVYLVD